MNEAPFTTIYIALYIVQVKSLVVVSELVNWEEIYQEHWLKV